MIVMAVLYRMKGFSLTAIAMAGAVMHNVGQVALAMVMLKTKELIYYMAVLMLVRLVTGFITGSVATALNRRIPPSLLQTEQKQKEETDGDKKRHAP